MELFIQISQFVLAISILVILHEFGHFLPARWFGIKVEKFFLFFDVKFALFKKKIGDTVYGVGWLPLGGYVKIAGMIDESMDKEQMAQPAQPWEFRSKPAWQRLIVMVGGVTVNVLLAWVIFSTLLVVNGDVYIPADRLKYGIEVTEEGEALGFQNGDQILSIDDKKVQKFGDGILFDILLGDNAVVLRDGKEVPFPISDQGKKIILESKKGAFLSPRASNVIGVVAPNSLATEHGIEIGDRIVGINGNSVTYWGQFEDLLADAKDENLTITLERNGSPFTKTFFIKEGQPVGVITDTKELLVKDEYGILASIPEGWNRTISSLTKQVRQFKLIFNKEVQGYKQVKGPIGIVEMMSPTWDWVKFWSFTAMFSVWLAFVNILPIPALDGGHVMFLLYEMISGKKPSEKTLERGQIIGFIIVMGLMLVIFGNDIWNLFK
ncbi:RIP metalloprotease RseP [uncultured Dokdonia sp.]|uniref:RIP metalloprotease RseP n=1 Tax=uncultured Dokdonia sp. TaxID=575653 RepID=UPI002637D88B|nr:RIP metalloprotease RseP [uncultured Dokdonia sp.]